MLNFFRRKKTPQDNAVKPEVAEQIADGIIESEATNQNVDNNTPNIIEATNKIVDKPLQDVIVKHEPKLATYESNQVVQKTSWAQRLRSGLSKTRDGLGKKLLSVFGGGKIDEQLYEELETILLSADVSKAKIQ